MDGGWQAEGKGCLETGASNWQWSCGGVVQKQWNLCHAAFTGVLFHFCEKTLGNLPPLYDGCTYQFLWG